MSLYAMTWAWELEEAPDGTPLTYADKLVLLALADHLNDQTNRCYPGLTRLCARTRLSDKPVRNAIRRLREMGLITVDRPDGLQAEYYLAVPEEITKAKLGNKTHAHPSDPARRNTPVRKTGHWKRWQTPVSEPESPVSGTQTPVPTTAITDSNRKEQEPPLPPKRGDDAGPEAERQTNLIPFPAPADQPRNGPVTRMRRQRAGAGLEGFDEFWALYPRKVSKGAAEKAWPRAVAAAGGDWTAIRDGLNARLHVLLEDHQRGFCKHPATWLNGKCWDDAIPGAEDLDDQSLLGRQV